MPIATVLPDATTPAHQGTAGESAIAVKQHVTANARCRAAASHDTKNATIAMNT